MNNIHDEPLQFETPILLKSQNISTKSSKSHRLLKKALELLLSVSLISLLLSFFTGHSFLHSHAYYFSTFFFPLLTQALERKYMFLLCNGILVFLAGKTCLSASSSSSSSSLQGYVEPNEVQSETMVRNNDQGITMQPAAPADPLYEEEAGTGSQAVGSPSKISSTMGEQEIELLKKTQEEGEEEKDYMRKVTAPGDSEKVAEAADTEEKQDKMEESEEESESILWGEGGGNNDIENEDSASNTEELNRRFEEFIRKMKEELRLEAQQQQLIAA